MNKPKKKKGRKGGQERIFTFHSITSNGGVHQSRHTKREAAEAPLTSRHASKGTMYHCPIPSQPYINHCCSSPGCSSPKPRCAIL
jgi:hypothetical protein